MYEQILAVVFVLLALAGIAVALGRRTPGGAWPALLNRKSKGLLAVQDRLVLGPQHSLHLVQWQGRTILVATHPGGVTFGPETEGFRSALAAAVGEESR